MSLAQQLIFLFSALGAINGFALSGYFLLFNKEKRLSDYFLGGLLLMLSIRIIKSVFRHFNPHLFELFIEFGLSACLLIGPFLFLYVTSIVKPAHRLRRCWWWHIVPFLIVITVFAYHYSYYQDRNIWGQFIELIYKQWGVYVVLTGYQLRHVLRKLWQRDAPFSSQQIWLLNIYFGTALIWLAYETSSYTSYIVGALSFSFVFYLSVLLWIYQRAKRSINDNEPVKYANSSLDLAEAQANQQRLEALMEKEKLYLDPSLTLTKLSERMELHRKDLSQIINQLTEHNYAGYIAHLRVEEAKRLLRLPDYQHYKISAIAYESGFNSLSSFNATFKRLTGITAKEFRKGRATG